MPDKIEWINGHAYFNGKPIADEVFGQHEDHIAFSPASQDTFNFENLIMLIAVIKLSKTSEGVKTLERIAIKYVDSCARIIESIQKSSAQNWLTALNNQHLAVGMMHRIGLLDDGAYIKIVEHYRAVFDKMLIPTIASATLGSVSTLIQGSTYERGERGERGEEGEAGKGVGALAAILKALA